MPDGWQLTDFIVPDRLLEDLTRISQESRYKAPEQIDHYVDWLCFNLRKYRVTRDECLDILYGFGLALEKQA